MDGWPRRDTILSPRLCSYVFWQICCVIENHHPRRLSRGCCSFQLVRGLQKMAHQNGFRVKIFIASQCEAAVECEEASHIKFNFSYYWFKSSDEVLSGPTWIPSRQILVKELKLSIVQDAMLDLLLHNNANGWTAFQACHSIYTSDIVLFLNFHLTILWYPRSKRYVRKQTRNGRVHNLCQMSHQNERSSRPEVSETSDFVQDAISQELFPIANNTAFYPAVIPYSLYCRTSWQVCRAGSQERVIIPAVFLSWTGRLPK